MKFARAHSGSTTEPSAPTATAQAGATTSADHPIGLEPARIERRSSTGRLVLDHARLAEQLAGHISSLRKARLDHHDVAAPLERLQRFLGEDLIGYLHTEEAALYAGDAEWRTGQRNRTSRRRVREHRRVITAAAATRSARTIPLAISRAELTRTLLEAHLRQEDRDLLVAARAAPDDGTRAALAAELQDAHAHDHVRIARAIDAARRAIGTRYHLDACDHATAALSQHAAVMSTRAYPFAAALIPTESTTVSSLREDLRAAERALRHLNRTARGAAGEEPANLTRLWREVERAWEHHAAEEEILLQRTAPLMRPEQTYLLLTLLRRPGGRSLTRQHPSLLRGGWPTRVVLHAQYRIDQWRDVLDNRKSLRIGD